MSMCQEEDCSKIISPEQSAVCQDCSKVVCIDCAYFVCGNCDKYYTCYPCGTVRRKNHEYWADPCKKCLANGAQLPPERNDCFTISNQATTI